MTTDARTAGGRGRLSRLLAIGWPYLAIVLYTVAFSAIVMAQVVYPDDLNEAAGRSSPRVAITFDDLPWNGPGYSDSEIAGLTDTLLATLTARGASQPRRSMGRHRRGSPGRQVSVALKIAVADLSACALSLTVPPPAPTPRRTSPASAGR